MKHDFDAMHVPFVIDQENMLIAVKGVEGPQNVTVQ